MPSAPKFIDKKAKNFVSFIQSHGHLPIGDKKMFIHHLYKSSKEILKKVNASNIIHWCFDCWSFFSKKTKGIGRHSNSVTFKRAEKLEIFKRYSQYWKLANSYGWVKVNTPYSPGWSYGICGKKIMGSFGLKTPGQTKLSHLKRTDRYSNEKKKRFSAGECAEEIFREMKASDAGGDSISQLIQNFDCSQSDLK